MDNENNNTEVKEFIQKVEVTPTQDTELIDEPEESSPQEKISEAEETETTPEKEEVEVTPVPEEVEPVTTEPKPVEGETPRERALRAETTRLRGLLRKERSDELLGGVKKSPETTPVDEELSQYDPEELKRAEKMFTKLGFVKKDELQSQTAQGQMDSTFNEFLEAHPELSPENDKDGVLWNSFKSEYALYNAPTDPKTLKKVLAKVHSEVIGIQPTANLNKINASREKIKVASHTGASTGKDTKPPTRSVSKQPLRTDGLIGFSEEELTDLLG